MRLFMLVALAARIPGTATSTALTLSVVLDRHLGYGAAGGASAAFTVGLAVGSPLLGRAVDRRGPRPVLCVTGIAALVFWTAAPLLPFPALVAAATVGGLLQVPIMALVRQSLAARVPPQQRRQAYSLDSMAVEVSFMVGPALAVLMITQLGDGISTLRTVGVALALSAAVMWTYNPRMTAHEAAEDGSPVTGAAQGRPDRRDWLSPGFLLVLFVAAAATVVLSGTDVSIVAVLRAHGQVQWAGVTIILWCAASLVGGFVHGAVPRPLGMLTLMTLLGAATIPVGMAHGWLLLALALIPAGLVCAPTVSQTVVAVSHAVPQSARGEALGLHAAALTLGNAVGAPLAGAVIDHSSPAFGFASVGVVGAAGALAAAATVTVRRLRRVPQPAAAVTPLGEALCAASAAPGE
ncbi:MFS transporter [Actinocrinis puniceicyclus]|uniref:MFS transporter n=1 Tax=Actinocrinis puniceicyclus TaxID=977794 RepID=A0A8J7WK20_9ACTN|nr:MFS transporter [Actinocrinis puniceicyclus]MBS2963721.1 MFS transporter [Actinocrinis puniceicyclus]